MPEEDTPPIERDLMVCARIREYLRDMSFQEANRVLANCQHWLLNEHPQSPEN